MKAVRFSTFGGPHEVAACVEVPDVGAPAAGEVVIEVEAFPINPADLLTLEGSYAGHIVLPATPGAECVGRIGPAALPVTVQAGLKGVDHGFRARVFAAVPPVQYLVDGDGGLTALDADEVQVMPRPFFSDGGLAVLDEEVHYK